MFAKLAIAALATLPVAFADVSGNANVALYWGQNSAGGADTQESLAYYCQNTDSDIVMVSFLNSFNGVSTPNLNLANACGTTFANSTTLSCPTVGADIKTCQSLGKTVLLSLGGAGATYDLTSAANAENLATQLWQMFGPVDSASSALRPFGDAVVDGFDLDIEQGTATYYTTLVSSLRSLYASDSSKTYYVSASPQCPVPDAHLNDVVTQSDLDFLFVQFYNNYCGMQSVGTKDFNFAAWDAIVKANTKRNTKVFLGVAGGPSAASSGYVDAATVIAEALALQSTYSSFGGVSIWDASQAGANGNFAKVVKAGIVPVASSSASSSATTAASSSAAASSAAASSASGSLVDPSAVTKCVNCDGSAVTTVLQTFTFVDTTDCDTATVKPTVTAHASCETLTIHTTYLTTVPCETTSNGVVGTSYSTVTVESTFVTTVTPAATAVVKTTSPAAAAVVVASGNSTTNGTSPVPVVAASSKTNPSVAASNSAARAVPGLLAVLGFLFL